MPRVTLPPDVQVTLLAALRRAGTRECGGILLAEHVGHNHFAVREVTVHKPGSIATFVRTLSGLAKAIRRFCASKSNDYARFNYLGEWHSHPQFSVQPSATDNMTMRSIAMDSTVGANFVVLLIFRLQGTKLVGSAHTYLPDGSINASELDFQEVTCP